MSARKRAPRSSTRGLDASQDAKRLGSVVLEVLSGLRGPTEASQVLGISAQSYYKLETRAVQGMLQALETREQRRRRAKPETELARVTAERDRLRRELLRAQALVRVAQRTVGLPAPASEKSVKPGSKGLKGKGQHKRTPHVRARRLAEELRQEAGDPAPAATPTSSAPATPPPARREEASAPKRSAS